jgi:hypothetical protein
MECERARAAGRTAKGFCESCEGEDAGKGAASRALAVEAKAAGGRAARITTAVTRKSTHVSIFGC